MKPAAATPLLPPLLCLCLFLTAVAAQPNNNTLDERAALLTFQGAAATLGWNEVANFCSWNRVTCATAYTGPVVRLNLSSLNLTGTIPELGAFSGLQILDLSYNNFSGTIPSSLGALSSLQLLNISNNPLLAGPVPPEAANLRSLEALDLSGNNLTGGIPPGLSLLRQLRYLNLTKNRQLAGAVPPELGDLAQLEALDLYECGVGGIIPPSFAFLGGLRSLRLGENDLSGEVPAWLGDLTELVELDLSWNRFSGSVPPQLANLKKVRVLKLHQNNFTGPFPPEFGGLSSVRRLYLANTKLSGPLPPTIGNLSMVEELHLDNCGLLGPIPPELGNLSNARYITMRKNNFKGEIPLALTKLVGLTRLRLDFNYLDGLVPDFGQTNLSATCNCLDSLPFLPLQRDARDCKLFYFGPQTSGASWRLIVGITVPLVFIFAGVAAAAVWFFVLRGRNDSEKFDGLKEHSYAELETATAGFRKSNLLGSGGSAHVYLGSLGGSEAAVKVLREKASTSSSRGEASQSDTNFRREVMGLGTLRHVNIVQLLGYSAEKGRPKALVYEFVPKGTLKALLYGSREKPPPAVLTFAQRMDIALQIARGLQYCHQSIKKPMIHRDIKPDNILMAVDEQGNWVPKIADFGLAKSVESMAINRNVAVQLKEELDRVLALETDSGSTYTFTLSTIAEGTQGTQGTQVAGTFGYLDPEYYRTGTPTIKSDVYSYGMLLLELLLGCTPTQMTMLREGRLPTEWLADLLESDQQQVVATVEQKLQQPVTDKKKCIRALVVANKCLNEEGPQRPTMRQVVRWLDDGGLLQLPALGSALSSKGV